MEQDRLSTAKKFADQLNDSRLWKIKISYQKRWTKHRRARKSVEIQYTKPWLRSSGRKPDIAKNYARHALRLQTRFIQRVNLLARCRKQGIPVPEAWLEETKALGNHVTASLILCNALIRVTGRNNE